MMPVFRLGVMWLVQQCFQAWHWHMTVSKKRDCPFLRLSLLRVGNFPEAPANFPLSLMKPNWFTCLVSELATGRCDDIMPRQFRLTQKAQGLQWGRGEYLKKKIKICWNDEVKMAAEKTIISVLTVCCISKVLTTFFLKLSFEIQWNVWPCSPFYRCGN